MAEKYFGRIPTASAAADGAAPWSRCRKERSASRWNRPRSRFWRSRTSGRIAVQPGRCRARRAERYSFRRAHRPRSIKNWCATRRSRWARAARHTFPAGKYPALFLFFVVPSSGHSVEENEKALYEIIEHVKKEKVDDATIARVKTKLRAALIRKLDSNSGLARSCAATPSITATGANCLPSFDEYDKVTADDVLRVAKTYLVENAPYRRVHEGSCGRGCEMKRRPSLALCLAGGDSRAGRFLPTKT